MVPASARLLTEAPHLADPVGQRGIALALRPVLQLALAHIPADVQTGHVAHGERSHRHAEIIHDAIHILGLRAFLDQEGCLATIGMQHTVADKAVAVSGQHRDLADLLAHAHHRCDGLLRRLFAAHVFQQPHHIGGAEEMGADDILGPLGGRGYFVDVQR